jgi:hypothetical protein
LRSRLSDVRVSRWHQRYFNDGGERVAYHDNVAGNAGGQYRTAEDVDIIAATANASGFVVYNFETCE